MKKIVLLFSAVLLITFALQAQSPIEAVSYATFNAYAGAAPDSSVPYFNDLGVRRVIVADADGDGEQEVLATDYTNSGRVHVLKYDGAGNLEIIWSSPIDSIPTVYGSPSKAQPRFPQVGDCDGDGYPEIVFQQSGMNRIVFYEWDGSSWGTEPAFEITNDKYQAATQTTRTLIHNRETLLVQDIDGDGKSEIITRDSQQRNVFILSIDGTFESGFASLVCEGGLLTETQNGQDYGITGSYWCSTPADIDGDGKLEILNHHWDKFGMWAIKVDGPDSYTYPDTSKLGYYNRYSNTDAVSYFGIAAADVDGDGRSELAGTMYSHGFDLGLFKFEPYDNSANLFFNDPDSIANRFGIIKTKLELAALAGKTSAEFWPCVKGDLNKDGKDEIYTGGGRGLNVIAVQYSGNGSLLDPNNYSANLVYAGEGADVFASYKIYNGRVDTVMTDQDTSYVLNPSIIDTVREETPFTAYIFADGVDLDKDGNMEMVISEQSVYDSTNIKNYYWVDSTHTWELNLDSTYKVINEYRKTIRVLEYTGATGLVDKGYNIVTPEDYKLENNYPNPFNPTTTIKFTLPLQKKISLKIYDMLGKEVATLINNDIYEKGSHEITWNATNNNGLKVASGNYIATLTYGNFSKSIKMTLLK